MPRPKSGHSSSHRWVYVDTSAYLTLLLRESGWKDVSHKMKNRALGSSVLLLAETHRNVVRLSREKILGPKDILRVQDRLDHDINAFALKDVSLDLCGPSPFPPIHTPRTLDLIHLRTALWFDSEFGLDAFISCDDKQLASARELRLPV